MKYNFNLVISPYETDYKDSEEKQSIPAIYINIEEQNDIEEYIDSYIETQKEYAELYIYSSKFKSREFRKSVVEYIRKKNLEEAEVNYLLVMEFIDFFNPFHVDSIKTLEFPVHYIENGVDNIHTLYDTDDYNNEIQPFESFAFRDFFDNEDNKNLLAYFKPSIYMQNYYILEAVYYSSIGKVFGEDNYWNASAYAYYMNCMWKMCKLQSTLEIDQYYFYISFSVAGLIQLHNINREELTDLHEIAKNRPYEQALESLSYIYGLEQLIKIIEVAKKSRSEDNG